jgi:hypothetical protein
VLVSAVGKKGVGKLLGPWIPPRDNFCSRGAFLVERLNKKMVGI